MDFLNKGDVIGENYFSEMAMRKIDAGSDMIINTMNEKNSIYGKVVSVDGRSISILTKDGLRDVKILDIIDAS